MLNKQEIYSIKFSTTQLSKSPSVKFTVPILAAKVNNILDFLVAWALLFVLA